MTYQLIVSTMNQSDDGLIDAMNIRSDAIIINQADSVGYHEKKAGTNTIKWYDFNERGIGLSRNSGLMRADADIIQFADDDMVFTDTYWEDVLKEYEKHPEADIILFSNRCLNEDRMPYRVTSFGKVDRLEGVKFGGARITARREKLLYHNISFSLLFGGGAKYGAGEDVTFLQDCLKAGLNVYKSPVVVSTMAQEDSSWFAGYNEKYFKDKGALLAANFPLICRVGILIQAVKNRKKAGYSLTELVRLYSAGVKEFNQHK